MKIGMVSLGCAKNQVDAEWMLGLLAERGQEIVVEPEEADVILVNTCGFIASAKQEAIDAILEMDACRKPGAKILVSGCLAQRYPEELLREMPEIDGLLGIGSIAQVEKAIGRMAAGERIAWMDRPYAFPDAPRLSTTSPHAVYLKVADGCDNQCAYCAIPGIRGKYISRPVESIVREADALLAAGAREITLVAQDTTRYGLDLYGEPQLIPLLGKLAGLGGDAWWRLLYLYPEMMDEKLLDALAATPGVCKYLDVPIQHSHPEVLRRMNRRGGREAIERMHRLARERGFTLRTTVLVGFPGETEQQFQDLMAFLREHPFDWLGAFAYSAEDGTPAADMPGQVPEEVKQERERLVMEQQAGITAAWLRTRIGSTERVLLEAVAQDEDGERFLLGRSQREAPEIDGWIRLPETPGYAIGGWADARITGSSEYDLEGAINA